MVVQETLTECGARHLLSANQFCQEQGFAVQGMKHYELGEMAKIKVLELRAKSKRELQTQIKDLKVELALLRVCKVTGGAPNKFSKIKVVNLSIAQVLTFLS
ncbi:hypothetical protein L7F22_010040 [Adiantum nelumboides]|nr:hypothetical protein [Adiantum nelumboides]